MLRSRTFASGYAICLDELVDYIMALLPSREVIVHATRSTQTQLPALAVREIVANALIHQDFSITGTGPLIEVFADRLEVTNAGAPLVDVMRIAALRQRSASLPVTGTHASVTRTVRQRLISLSGHVSGCLHRRLRRFPV